MESLWDYFVSGIIGGVGQIIGQYLVQALILFGSASGVANLMILKEAWRRPRTTRKEINQELDRIEGLALEAYQCVIGGTALNKPRAIEDSANVLIEKLGFLATMESLKNKLSEYERVQGTIRCAESIEAFGRFVRNYCNAGRDVKAPGKKTIAALQRIGEDINISEVTGIPEAVQSIRDVLDQTKLQVPSLNFWRCETEDPLKTARDSAVKLLLEKKEYKLREPIFLRGGR